MENRLTPDPVKNVDPSSKGLDQSSTGMEREDGSGSKPPPKWFHELCKALWRHFFGDWRP